MCALVKLITHVLVTRLQDEEQDLSDAFKKRLGLIPGDEPNGIEEITAPVASYDIERDATVNKIKFDKFIKSSFQTKTSPVFVKNPLTQPLLVKNNEVDRLVIIYAYEYT